MGNNPIITENNNHNEVRQITDDRFGGKIMLQWHNSQIYASRAMRMISKQQLSSTIELVKKRCRLTHKNFSTVKDYNVYQLNEMCSEIIHLNLIYEFYENDLEKQIKRRSPKQEYFEQQMIWKHLFQLCDCLRYLKQRKCYHGDIRSSTVFLDKKHNIKLQDSYFTHQGKTNLEFMISRPNTYVYLSPSQMVVLKKGGFASDQNDLYKNQMFSLGMTLMEVMLLQSSYDCYDMISYRINIDKIKEKKTRMKKNYSESLVQLIGEMLDEHAEKRPNYQQILQHPKVKQNSNIKMSLIREQGVDKQPRISIKKDLFLNRASFQSVQNSLHRKSINYIDQNGQSKSVSQFK